VLRLLLFNRPVKRHHAATKGAEIWATKNTKDTKVFHGAGPIPKTFVFFVISVAHFLVTLVALAGALSLAISE